MSHFARLVLGVFASLLLVSTAHATAARQPHAISFAFGVPGGFGADMEWSLSERTAVAVQASTWLAVSDLGVRYRWRFLLNAHSDLYVQGGAHALASPILFRIGAPAVSVGIGAERWRRGFVLAGEAGAYALWAPPGSEGGGNELGVVPLIQVRIGHAW